MCVYLCPLVNTSSLGSCKDRTIDELRITQLTRVRNIPTEQRDCCVLIVAVLRDCWMDSGYEGFPATQVMRFAELPAAKRKSDRLVFFDCGCRLPRLARAPRSLWMHLLPPLRLYKCGRCGAKVLRLRLPLSSPYPLPRTPLPRSRPMTASSLAHPHIVVADVVQLVVGAPTGDFALLSAAKTLREGNTIQPAEAHSASDSSLRARKRSHLP